MRSLTSDTAHSDSTQPCALSRMAVISFSDMMRLRAVVEGDCFDFFGCGVHVGERVSEVMRCDV